MRLVQIVWWWDRWLTLPRMVKWENAFLDRSFVIGPMEIRVWKAGWGQRIKQRDDTDRSIK